MHDDAIVEGGFQARLEQTDERSQGAETNELGERLLDRFVNRVREFDLVRGGPFNPIDDDDRNRVALGFKLQAQLFAKGGEYGDIVSRVEREL